MHKTDQVLNFAYVAMNGTRKKCETYSIIICLTSELVFLFILNRDLKEITLSRWEGFAYILRLTNYVLLYSLSLFRVLFTVILIRPT